MGLIPDINEVSIPRQKLGEYNILIFGDNGKGKSSFANAFPKCLMGMFEDSTKAMVSNSRVFAHEIAKVPKKGEKGYSHEWTYFKDLLDEILKGGHPYQTIGVDTITRGYEKCTKYFVDEVLPSHPSIMQKNDDNSGYSLINSELKETFGKLLNSKYGTVLTAHARMTNAPKIKGVKEKEEVLVPDTGGSFGRWVMGEVDVIIFLTLNDNDERVMVLEGTRGFKAKQRLPFGSEPIVIQCKDDSIDVGKYSFEVFQKEFSKALDKLNKRLNVTQEMIDIRYAKEEKEEKKQLKMKENLNDKIEEIVSVVRELGWHKNKATVMMKKEINCANPNQITSISDAEKFIDFLNSQEG